MKRILFVDDEVSVLTGLRNSLRSRRAEWDCTFMSDPEAALTALEKGTFDVIVSDMRMPKVDGAKLLAAAKRLQPKAARMILSGQTELDSVKSVLVAHVFLAKPCDPEALQKVIDRSCRLLALLDRDDLKSAIGAVEMLPAIPQTYVELTELLAHGKSSVAEMARVIERDLALSAKVLHLSNSAFFGIPRKITSIAEAVTFLGTNTLKNIALALSTFSASANPGMSPTEMDELSRFSLQTARIARKLAGANHAKAEEAFLAGLLHAVGRLIPISKQLSDPAGELSWPLLGAYLLGLWGLPHAIIEAIAYHQRPRVLPHESFELVDMVHLAHHVACDLRGSDVPPGVDREHLGKVGCDDTALRERLVEIRGAFAESEGAGQARKELSCAEQ